MKKVVVPCLTAMVFALAAAMPLPGEADIKLSQANLKIDKDKFCGKRS